ncbi:MAG TPA: tryptophan synthase subunit beta [Candidatus Acidoferrales bacterium]|nr:tryptophan synthase subunit beta [Candidatus Acidoferrales bacterium]
MKVKKGMYATYGGQYVAETLMAPLLELEKAYETLKEDPEFLAEFEYYLKNYAGRPTPVYRAKRFSELCHLKIFLKREDLCHSGAHKINNVIGQALIAKKLAKKNVICETGAGQHGVATSMACAMMGLKCQVYMGTRDMERQKPNVIRMKLLGADVIPVESGSCTLKDAVNEALRQWTADAENAYYLMGSALGPHPYPAMVRDFQRVIGIEAKSQISELEGRLPDAIVACAGGGSNAMGIFTPFLNDNVELIAVEAGGISSDKAQKQGMKAPHAIRLTNCDVGVFHGMKTRVLQDRYGQILETTSISAGLDYSGVGPELAHLVDIGRVLPRSAQDDEVLASFEILCKTEGIIPALESSHALAYAMRACDAGDLEPGALVIINLSGRGDKDVNTVIGRRRLGN